MSLTELCTHCGFHNSAHSANCPRVFAPVTPLPTAYDTAYDRDQQALRDRLEALESCAVGTSGSLVDARRRIEQLELEVARLKCPRVTKADVDVLESIAAEQRQIQKTLDSVAVAYPPLPDEGT